MSIHLDKYSGHTLLFVVAVCLMLSALGQSGCQVPRSKFDDQDQYIQALLDEGEELRTRRLFDQAILRFNDILELNPLHEEATYQIALTYYKAHRWQEAMDWFDAVRIVDPQRREAFTKRWTSIPKVAAGDTLLARAASKAVRREIASFLKRYPWDWETLETARDGALIVKDSVLTEELTRRILQNYPDSPASYRIVSNLFYDSLYPIWADDEKKENYIIEFLSEHRHNDFRETAWLYLLHTQAKLNKIQALKRSLQDWMAEEPESPVPYERAVHYLLEKGIAADSLLPIAREAVDKSRGWRGKSLKHIEQRIMEGKQLYAGTRLNIARILIRLDRTEEARLWLEDGQRNCGYGVNDNGTRASFNYFLGVIAEMQGLYEEAFNYFIQALIEGDVRYEWTAKADSAATKLYAQHIRDGSSDLMEKARDRLNYTGPVFEDVTIEMGFQGVKASRVAWGDANGDGYDDLLLGGKRLFINQAGRGFTEVTERCGLRGKGIRGGVWADVDMDGDLDLFCAGNGGDEGRDRLYINESIAGEAVPLFREVTQAVGSLRDSFPTEGAAWGDLQGDGRPDLYVANYEVPGSELGNGTPDYLYINLPDSVTPKGFRFQRLGPDDGLEPPFGENLCGRGVNWGDFDGDGDQDVYVSNYRLQENFLWRNEGESNLVNLAAFFGIAGFENDGWWGHTIGSEWGDFDNDGDLDLIAANLAHPRYIEFSDRTCLYENRLDEDGQFRDVRELWGIKYEETHSDPAWADVDADGDLDLFITSIYPNRRSFLYLNDLNQRKFIDVTFLSNTRVFNSWGCAFSDFDNDGDLDLAVGSTEGIHIFRNDSRVNNWLKVNLDVPGGGYGTRIVLIQGEKLQMRELNGGKGTTSQHSHTQFFGLGGNASPVNLEVTFPNRDRVDIEGIKPNQNLTIDEKRIKNYKINKSGMDE